MGKLPEGDQAPLDGALPASTQSLSLYLHIPFCARRCGYCDFNTFTAEELVRDGVSVTHDSYVDVVLEELKLARRVLGDHDIQIPTIFIGGGTPSLIEPTLMAKVLDGVRNHFDLRSGAEVTIEANPDSVTAESLAIWRASGINRISMGMQSAVPHVLEVLDRTHKPENVERAVRMARSEGFEQVSVDLIYGAPGESLDDWSVTLENALGLHTDHISAYALIVEEGTKLAAQINRGDVVMPEDDETAAKYEMADEAFGAAGMPWYELSNWSKSGSECQHNIAYWQSRDWWGIGPGAHSHVKGVRWWNVKHPAAYAAKLNQNHSPAAARETLSDSDQKIESILLQLRLRSGLKTSLLDPHGIEQAQLWITSGHLERAGERLVLTRPGRLVADAIARSITPDF